MKHQRIMRNLHMGCGEGLVGRVRRVPVGRTRVRVVPHGKPAEQPAGKDKR